MVTSSKHRKAGPRPVARVERQHTAMCYLFRLLRFLNMKRTARILFRTPKHVADLYANGQYVRSLYMGWRGVEVTPRTK
jgi:hypothetical protein